jgi:hypothetical protein
MGLEIALFTALAEFATIIARLIFGSKKEKFDFNPPKIRIHHGYVGIAILLVASLFFPYEAVFILGWVLFLSDALHHFVVLPLWVKRTEFP